MTTPLELVQSLLSNPTNIEHVRSLTTADVMYVSLNFDNPDTDIISVLTTALAVHHRRDAKAPRADLAYFL